METRGKSFRDTISYIHLNICWYWSRKAPIGSGQFSIQIHTYIQVYSRKFRLVFLYSKNTLTFSTHQSFSLWILNLETVLAVTACLCDTSFRPSRNWQKGEKPATDLLYKVIKIYFFSPAVIHFTVLNAIISEFGARLAQNNIAQKQP